MARSRNLKPGFFTNEELSQLPDGARLLFAGLWTIADREGRLKDSPTWIKANLFPYKNAPVEKWLDLLASSDFIVRYESGRRRFIQIVNFLKHQNPHMKEPESLIPAPDSVLGSAPNETGTSTYIDRGNPESRNGESGIRNPESDRGRVKRFEPPDVADVAAYCLERKNTIDPQAFVDFYTSKGWKVGNQAMKDWRASVRTWERNQRSNGTKSPDDPRGNIATLNRYLETQRGDDEPGE